MLQHNINLATCCTWAPDGEGEFMFTCNPSGCRWLRAEPPQRAAPLVPRRGIAVNLPSGLWHRVRHRMFGTGRLNRGTPIPTAPVWRRVRSLPRLNTCDAEGFPAPQGDGATAQCFHGTKAKTRLGISAGRCTNCCRQPAAGPELCPP